MVVVAVEGNIQHPHVPKNTAKQSKCPGRKRKSTLNIHWKDWCWSWNSNTWPPDAKNWLNGKDPEVGKNWRQEEKGTTADEMVGWYHWLNGREFEQASEVGDGQGSLACCSPWCHLKSWTRLSNWTELKLKIPSSQVQLTVDKNSN